VKSTKYLIITVLLVTVVGAGSFFAGTKYQSGCRSTFNSQLGNGQNFSRSGRQFPGGNGTNNGNPNGGFHPVNGEIINLGDNSLTVKMPDGGSKIAVLTNSTIYNQTSPAAKSDLQIGNQVGVFGTTNSDGSVTAQTIQLNPLFRNSPAPSSPTHTP
jgi:hypothetical protein